MSVWRDLREQAGRVEQRRRWQPVRVLGVYGGYPLAKGKKHLVLVAVDLGCPHVDRIRDCFPGLKFDWQAY
jgi:hypothetical protein